MEIENVKVKCLFFQILPEFSQTGIPSQYCSNNKELLDVIKHNKQYKLILVCNGEHIQQLHEILISPYIREIFVLGNCPRLDFQNKEVTIVNTNERALMLDIILSVMNYIHDEEIQQRELGNHRMGDERAMDILQLLEQIETL